MQKVAVDSLMDKREAIKQNPLLPCPDYILNKLQLCSVLYYSFDGLVHGGQIVSHKDLVDDITGAFKLLKREKFPIQTVIPMSDPRYQWSDDLSTAANNTSAFNYRKVRFTNILSYHATGCAIDINPKLNPYFPGGQTFPPNASYDVSVPGTILADSNLVRYFKNLGWTWGGDWTDDPDYQHFEKMC